MFDDLEGFSLAVSQGHYKQQLIGNIFLYFWPAECLIREKLLGAFCAMSSPSSVGRREVGGPPGLLGLRLQSGMQCVQPAEEK